MTATKYNVYCDGCNDEYQITLENSGMSISRCIVCGGSIDSDNVHESFSGGEERVYDSGQDFLSETDSEDGWI
jgi:ribosomal protein S27E